MAPAIFDHPIPRRVFPGRTSWSLTMRKLLTLWIALAALLIAPVHAQRSLLLRDPLHTAAAGCSLDVATCAWVNQVTTNGGTVSAGRQTVVNTFITCLKDAGSGNLFNILDCYWLFAGENTQSALTDMVALASATNHGMTFTASVDYDNVAARSKVRIRQD
jgi:hypothetical protein